MITKPDLHFLQMATLEAQRDPNAIVSHSKESGPSRNSRGAILVKDSKIIAQGVSQHLGGNLYKPEAEERYVATVNAELVAIGDAIKKGHAPLSDLTLYISDAPNWYTFKMLIEMGIKRIVHYGPVGNDRISHYAQELGIELVSVG